jgi:hypothetical protein
VIKIAASTEEPQRAITAMRRESIRTNIVRTIRIKIAIVEIRRKRSKKNE